MNRLVKIVYYYSNGYKVELDMPKIEEEQIKPFNPPTPNTDFSAWACHVCGLSGLNGYVCPNPKCPTAITCTSI